MENKRIWIVLVAILVIVNIGSIGFLWLGKQRHHGAHERMEKTHRTERIIRDRLNLSEEQQFQFKEERDRHFKSVKPLERKLRKTKKDLFERNMAEAEISSISPMLADIRRLQGDIDSLTYMHFATLRSYCRDDQKEEFNKMLRMMVRRGVAGGVEQEKHRQDRRMYKE